MRTRPCRISYATAYDTKDRLYVYTHQLIKTETITKPPEKLRPVWRMPGPPHHGIELKEILSARSHARVGEANLGAGPHSAPPEGFLGDWLGESQKEDEAVLGSIWFFPGGILEPSRRRYKEACSKVPRRS